MSDPLNNKRRAMLIEDSPTQAERLRRLLAAADLDVTHVLSAEAAFDRLALARPDVIVVDRNLPGKTGNDFCREIKASVNTRAIPVLMLTVDESDTAQMRGLESGADDYVSKAADPDILRARIRALLRESPDPASIVNGKSFSRPRVLAIDDSPAYLYFISEELKRANYQVETASGPREGLAKISSAPYDCVLVDFEMPGENGPEVCRKIRSMGDETNPQVVLIMLSSHEDKEHMQLGFDAGADDYISKSADRAIIRARVGALLRRKFLIEQNRQIMEELRERELETVRAEAAREAAEIRAQMADRLAEANRQLALSNTRLDQANRELESFAYSMAHDLQEPLRMIGISSELLQVEYAERLDEKANEFLSRCVQGARRMDTFIRDLLIYVRATSTETELPRSLVNLNELASRVLANLEGARVESGSEITVGNLPALIVEETRIQQLLQNLIGNAIRYRRAEVKPRIRVSAERGDGLWTFSVADNGIGIDPEDCERVFAPFKRLSGTHSPGSGLGLAICRRIVERHGGRIWVEPAPGHGSVFRFTLPGAETQGA